MFSLLQNLSVPVRTVDGGTDWAAWIAAAAATGSAVILAVSAFFIWRQLDSDRVTRTGELITHLSTRWDLTQYQHALVFSRYTETGMIQLIERLFGAGTPAGSDLQDYLTIVKLPNLIEEIGVLQSIDSIDLEVIDRMWGLLIRSTWVAWEPIIDVLRPYAGYGSFSEFERLVADLAKRGA
jgi:hypothetical protein